MLICALLFNLSHWVTRKKNNELGQGKKKGKKRQKEREIFSPLTHKLHQFTLRIRLHLKKKGGRGRLELDGTIQIKIGKRGSRTRNCSPALSWVYFIISFLFSFIQHFIFLFHSVWCLFVCFFSPLSLQDWPSSVCRILRVSSGAKANPI